MSVLLGGLLSVCNLAPAAGRGIPLGIPLTARGYERLSEHGGITVYRRPHSKTTELSAEGIIPVPLARVQQFLLDYASHKGRVARIAESRVLQRSPTEALVYQRIDLPLISDRDCVMHVRWGSDGPVRWIEFAAVTDRGPSPRKGLVRITHHQGSWELKPLAGGTQTYARYELSIDLAGYLPRWMARSRASKEVFTLFRTICRATSAPGTPQQCER